MGSLLFGVKADDPLTMGLSAAILLSAALGAAMVPAASAARVDPVAVLRED